MSNSQLQNDILLARYNWVLARKSELNDLTFKIIGIFGSVAAALLTGQSYIVAQNLDKKLSSSAALFATYSCLLAWLGLIAFSTALLIINFVNWVSYRSQEVELEKFASASFAKKVDLRSLFNWFETYILLLFLISIPTVIAVYFWYVIPVIK